MESYFPCAQPLNDTQYNGSKVLHSLLFCDAVVNFISIVLWLALDIKFPLYHHNFVLLTYFVSFTLFCRFQNLHIISWLVWVCVFQFDFMFPQLFSCGLVTRSVSDEDAAEHRRKNRERDVETESGTALEREHSELRRGTSLPGVMLTIFLSWLSFFSLLHHYQFIDIHLFYVLFMIGCVAN